MVVAWVAWVMAWVAVVGVGSIAAVVAWGVVVVVVVVVAVEGRQGMGVGVGEVEVVAVALVVAWAGVAMVGWAMAVVVVLGWAEDGVVGVVVTSRMGRQTVLWVAWGLGAGWVEAVGMVVAAWAAWEVAWVAWVIWRAVVHLVKVVLGLVGAEVTAEGARVMGVAAKAGPLVVVDWLGVVVVVVAVLAVAWEVLEEAVGDEEGAGVGWEVVMVVMEVLAGA